MFLSEWREFPSAPCLAGGKKFDDSSRLDVVEITRIPDVLPSVSTCVGKNTRNSIQYFLTVVLFTFCTCCILRCLVCVVVSCLVCIVVVFLCVLL